MTARKEFIGILEDDVAYGNLLRRTLIEHDDSKEYFVANSPKELFEKAKQYVAEGLSPALFILDVDMEFAKQKGENSLEIMVHDKQEKADTGVKAGKFLKNMYAEAGVILHTGRATASDYQEAINSGNIVDAVTVKNADTGYAHLFNAIQDVLDKRERKLAHNYGSGKGSTVFITGTGGFWGGAELEAIVQDPNIQSVFLNLRVKTDKGKVVETYEDRSAKLLQTLPEEYRGKVVPVDWDLLESIHELEKRNPEAYKRLLSSSKVEIRHNAAILDFVSDAKTVSTVFEGNLVPMSHMITLAKALQFAGNLAGFIYRSTAYVSGAEYGRVLNDDERLRPVRHLNFYETSKLVDEDMLTNAGIPYRIERLGILTGDLQGKRYTHDTLYGVLEMMYRITKKGKGTTKDTMLNIVGDPDATNNFIPLDDALRMTKLIRSSDPDMKGQVYHITHPLNTVMTDLFEGFAEVLGTKFAFIPYLGENASSEDKMLNVKMLGPRYETYLAKRDVTRAQENFRALPGGPAVLESIPLMTKAVYRQLAEHYLKQEHGVEFEETAKGKVVKF
jgi:nucleoside-diphosphate-sugar epimerase